LKFLFSSCTNSDKDVQFLYNRKKDAKLRKFKIPVIDIETGELRDQVLSIAEPPRPRYKGWIRMKQDAISLLLEKELSAGELRVFLYLCSRVTMNSACEISPKEVQAKARVARTRYNQVLSSLSRHGLIWRDPAKPNLIFVDPSLGYYGPSDFWSRAMSTFSQRVAAAAVPAYPDAEALLKEMLDGEAT
jgi:hypothetical protein